MIEKCRTVISAICWLRLFLSDLRSLQLQPIDVRSVFLYSVIYASVIRIHTLNGVTLMAFVFCLPFGFSQLMLYRCIECMRNLLLCTMCSVVLLFCSSNVRLFFLFTRLLLSPYFLATTNWIISLFIRCIDYRSYLS